jgi:hypothetical protein
LIAAFIWILRAWKPEQNEEEPYKIGANTRDSEAY